MKHFFEVGIAKEYGVNAAILLENIAYWTAQNEANEINFYDGKYWTFNSRRAFRELFPYMSEKQIYNALQKLIDAGLIVTGNYNRLAYDRTLWYALSQKGKSIVRFDTMDCTERDNGNSQKGQPIPDINTNINAVINTDIESRARSKRFTPPDLAEVSAYCRERGNNVSPERFIDYYTSNGWKVGKNPMKDWKAAVRNWEKDEKPKKPAGEAKGKKTFAELVAERSEEK